MALHAASLEKSERLKRVLAVLQDGAKHTTRDIIRKAKVCAVNSIAAEIRANGIQVECERRGSKWFYWLAQ